MNFDRILEEFLQKFCLIFFADILVTIHYFLIFFRDYFLSDRHVCLFQQEGGQCIVCEVSRLFQEFYSGMYLFHTVF